MRKALLFLVVGLVLWGVSAHYSQAATIDGTAPTVSDPVNGDAVNAILATAFDNALGEASDDFGKFKKMENLAKGFGNANVYSGQVATLQGYQNYLRCAITVGAMVGVQLPSLNPDYYDDLEDVIDRDGDIYAGVGAGISFINVGVNASSVHPGLYLNAKFGSLTIKPQEDVEIKNTIFGVGANYCLVKGIGQGQKLFKWRGLSLGTGFLYHSSKVDFKIEQDEIAEALDSSIYDYYPTATNAQLLLDPSFNLGLDVKTTTIPVDISTSIQLLWLFNFNLGAGVDFNFGSTDIILSSKGGVTVDGIPDTVPVTAGKVIVDGSTLGIGPSSVCTRIMTGIGFNFSMVKIDVPIIFYPSKGASVGVTAGVVW